MNKYQEVLKRLRTNEYLTSREQRQYYNLLQSLVDKETPKKLYYEGDGYADGVMVYDVYCLIYELLNLEE